MALCPALFITTTVPPPLPSFGDSDGGGLPLPDFAILDSILVSRAAYTDSMDIVPPIRKRRYSNGPGALSPRKRARSLSNAAVPSPPPSPSASSGSRWKEDAEERETKGGAPSHNIDLFAMLPVEVILYMADITLVTHPQAIIALASTSRRMYGILKGRPGASLWRRVADEFGMDVRRLDAVHGDEDEPDEEPRVGQTSHAFRSVMAACQRTYVLWTDDRMRCFAFGGFGDGHAPRCSARRGPRTGSCCLTAEDVHRNEAILTRVAVDLVGKERSRRRLFIDDDNNADDDPLLLLDHDDLLFTTHTDGAIPSIGRESDDDSDNDDYGTEPGDATHSPFHTPPRLLHHSDHPVQPPGAPLRNKHAHHAPSIRSLIMSMTIRATPLEETEEEYDDDGDDDDRHPLDQDAGYHRHRWNRPVLSFSERWAANRDLLLNYPDKWFAATMVRSARSGTSKPIMSLGPLGFRHNHSRVLEAVYRAVISHTHATVASSSPANGIEHTSRITDAEAVELSRWLRDGSHLSRGGSHYPVIYMALVACNVLGFSHGVEIRRCMTAARPYEWLSAPCTCKPDTATNAMAWMIATGDAYSSCPFHGSSAVDAVRSHGDAVDVADAAMRKNAALSGAIRRIISETLPVVHRQRSPQRGVSSTPLYPCTTTTQQ